MDLIRRSRSRCRVALAGVVAVVPFFAGAATPLQSQTVDGSNLTVSLITVAPGSKSWEMFGHNAIRVRDTARGTDVSYNYGLFSFEQENFLLRFIQGRMLYWMAGLETDAMLAVYSGASRSIWEQQLNLTPEQRVELRDFLVWNARPENAYYRYDYYFDNCSTRVRDAIDRVIGGGLRSVTEAIQTGATFRSHTQRLTTGNPFLYTGLLLGLGNPVDRPISAWEEMFLPLEVMRHVADVEVRGPDGGLVPLVRSVQTLFEGTRPPPDERPPRWLPWYLVLGVAIGGGIVVLSRRVETARGTRVAFAALTGVWTLALGAAGFLLLGFWTLTDHAAAFRNENLFFASPIALPLAVLLVLGVRRLRSAGVAARWLAYALAASSLVGLVIQAFPGFDQVNGQLLALAVPANLGVAIAVNHLTPDT